MGRQTFDIWESVGTESLQKLQIRQNIDMMVLYEWEMFLTRQVKQTKKERPEKGQ